MKALETQHYVLGYAFLIETEEVLLIKKTKPAWMVGKLNGVGGKVESEEHPLDSMIREFKEETNIDATDWQCFGKEAPYRLDDTYCIHLYYTTISPDQFDQLKQTTDESLHWVPVVDVLFTGVSEKYVPGCASHLLAALTHKLNQKTRPNMSSSTIFS